MTTNNRTYLGRRGTFAMAFTAYPTVLKGFASGASLGHEGAKSRLREEAAQLLLTSPFFPYNVACVLSALFGVKLLVLRIKAEEELPEEDRGDLQALQAFVNGANLRLQEFTAEKLKGFSLSTPDLPAKALRAFEEDMAGIVFNALSLDGRREDFDEASFWADVFRALADTDPSGAIVRGLSVVVLDRLGELRHALRVSENGHVLDLQAATAH